MNEDLPFVSFCIKCYNQKDLIGEALKGAFEQTYPNMEIVISDDASTDGSVNVIKKLVSEYESSGGKFPVTIIENECNQGNGGNWQKLCTVAKGEWFVKADGDDRSLPTRVEDLMNRWIAGGRKAYVLGSDAFLMDMEGRSLGPVRRAVLRTNRVAGCVAAYHRKCFDLFGEFSVKNAADDAVYGVRASYFGSTDFVDKPLVLYRVGAGTCRTVKGFRSVRVKSFKATTLWTQQCHLDLEHIKLRITAEKHKEMEQFLLGWEKESAHNIMYWGGSRTERKALVSIRPLKSLLSVSGLYKIALIMPDSICDFIIDSMSQLHNFILHVKYGQRFKGCDGHEILKSIMD